VFQQDLVNPVDLLKKLPEILENHLYLVDLEILEYQLHHLLENLEDPEDLENQNPVDLENRR